MPARQVLKAFLQPLPVGRPDIPFKNISDPVEIRQVPDKHALQIRETSTKCGEYSNRLRFGKTLKRAVAKRFGEAFGVVCRFDILQGIGQQIKAVGRPLEIRLGNLNEIGREINSKPSPATREYRIANRAIAAAEIEQNVVRTHIKTLPNRVDDHCDLIGTCVPHHLALEIIGVARASMRFVEQGEVDFGHLPLIPWRAVPRRLVCVGACSKMSILTGAHRCCRRHRVAGLHRNQ